MNWLITAQSKPMALPFKDKVPTRMTPGNYPYRGKERIDLRMRSNTAKNEEKKYPDIQYLGQGQHGVAYLNPSQKTVVKYTSEPSEAFAAEKIKNNPIPCVNKIRDVRVVQYDELNEPSVWSVVADKVTELNPKQQAQVKEIYHEIIMSLEIPQFYPIQGEGKSGNIKQDYIELIKCLSQNGLKFTDAHQENVGYTEDGRLVLFDLGLSMGNPNQHRSTTTQGS